MYLKFAGALDKGKVREENQDAIFVPAPGTSEQKQIFILADGMGGANAGGLASQLAVQTISEKFLQRGKSKGLKASVLNALQAAASTVHGQSQESPDKSGMGTTVVALALAGEEALVTNVGDSRCYLWRDYHLQQITRDHSLVQDLIDQGNLSPEEAKTHEYRNVLTQALGNKPDIEADFFPLDLTEGDVLMLCSDGLHGVVDEPEIARALSDNDDLQGVADRLVAMANQKGGPDNISVVLVQIMAKDEAAKPKERLTPKLKGLSSKYAQPLQGLKPRFKELSATRTLPPRSERARWGLGLAGAVLLVLLLIWLWPSGDGSETEHAPAPGPATQATAEPSPTAEPALPAPTAQEERGAEARESDPPKSEASATKPAQEAPGPAPGPSVQPASSQPSQPPAPRQAASKAQPKTPTAVVERATPPEWLAASLYHSKDRIYYQLGAFSIRDSLKRALDSFGQGLASSDGTRAVWTLSATQGKNRLLYMVYLTAPSAKIARQAIKKLSGIKPVPVNKRPQSLPAASRFTFRRSRMRTLDGAALAKEPLAMVLLAGSSMTPEQAALTGEILNAGPRGLLMVVDAGAGRKTTLALAREAAQKAGQHRVLLYKGGRFQKRDELTVDRDQLSSFVLAVATACPNLSQLPPISVSPNLKAVGRAK